MAESGAMASVTVSATLELVRNTCNLLLTLLIFKLGLIAWCFPCITYANIKHRYEHLNTKGFPDPEHGGSFCNSDCIIHGAITGCCGMGWIFQVSSLSYYSQALPVLIIFSQMGQRGSIRQRYNIKGGSCGDCCTALCCTPCELTQEARELELEEQSFGGHHGKH